MRALGILALAITAIPATIAIVAYLAGYVHGCKLRRAQMERLESAKAAMLASGQKVLASNLGLRTALEKYRDIERAANVSTMSELTKH